jgi:hypothetical protein
VLSLLGLREENVRGFLPRLLASVVVLATVVAVAIGVWRLVLGKDDE